MAVKTEQFDLTGKAALITGGASGIGKAIAEAFIRHGARVLVGSRTTKKVEQAVIDLARATEADEADDAQPIVVGTSLDVESDESIDAAVQKCVDEFGRLDILVNCAGTTFRKPTFDVERDEFNWLYNIHVAGSLRCAQAAGHLMREQHSGCIINIASITSFVDLVEVAGYAAAKSAILGLTRTLANEWAQFGIRTNGIAPGFIPTDLNRHLIERTERGRRIMEHTPMARFGTADEVAPAAVYLASPAGAFVNGITITVDGGYLACGVGTAEAPWPVDE